MFPKRLENLLFSAVLSGLMSCLVAGLSTLRITGWTPVFPGQWMLAWLTAWPLAFPAVMVMAPLARRIVRHLVREKDD